MKFDDLRSAWKQRQSDLDDDRIDKLADRVGLRASWFEQNDLVTIKNDTGIMAGQKLQAYPIKQGNIMMYYPESNVLVPRQFDPQSKTPSFKSIEVFLEKQL